jgi:hypothetical protein
MISIKPANKGLLHQKMGVAADKPIPAGALQKKKVAAKKSGNVKTEREAVFAQNAKKWGRMK